MVEYGPDLPYSVRSNSYTRVRSYKLAKVFNTLSKFKCNLINTLSVLLFIWIVGIIILIAINDFIQTNNTRLCIVIYTITILTIFIFTCLLHTYLYIAKKHLENVTEVEIPA